MSRDFIGINHGTGKIAIGEGENEITVDYLPVEIHLKEDGSKDDKPSFAILMSRPETHIRIVGQLSLEMFNEGLADIGYELIKK